MRSRRSGGGPPAAVTATQLCVTALLVAAVLTTPAIAMAKADVELEASTWRDLTHWDTRTDTLWIFDADFEDLLGDNDGWESEDWSPTAPCTNYWHKDTIHMWNQHPSHPLGDSTWWCGTYDNCWVQPRGYGNNWICVLEREFPEVDLHFVPQLPRACARDPTGRRTQTRVRPAFCYRALLRLRVRRCVDRWGRYVGDSGCLPQRFLLDLSRHAVGLERQYPAHRCVRSHGDRPE